MKERDQVQHIAYRDSGVAQAQEARKKPRSARLQRREARQVRRHRVVHACSAVQHQLLQPRSRPGDVAQAGSGDARAVEVQRLQLLQVAQLGNAGVADCRAAAQHQLLQLFQPALRARAKTNSANDGSASK